MSKAHMAIAGEVGKEEPSWSEEAGEAGL